MWEGFGIGMADTKISERFSNEMNDRQETTDKLLSIMFGESAVEELRKYEDDIYVTNRFINTEFRDYEFGIAENDEDIEAFHKKFWRCGVVKMKREVLQALLDGKAILFDDGEFSTAIILDDELKDMDMMKN